jgi:fructose 1,6-bisphosphate aldolase/phosphatase
MTGPAGSARPPSSPSWLQWLLPLAFLVGMWLLIGPVGEQDPDELTYSQFLSAVGEGRVEAVVIAREGEVEGRFCPEDYYSMLMLVGAPGRYGIRRVRSRALDLVCAVSSTQRLSEMAGRYVGKDDPVLAVRCQSGLPAVGEVLEPFAFPFTVAGWMRGSHHGPLMPCSVKDATPAAFDGPPRVVALGFQIHDGRLVGPRDMFADVSFDRARRVALEVADYLRRHGPFEPHRLPMDELEYTTMPSLMKELAGRWQPEPA